MTYTPELGQMAFGAAYGEFSTPSFVTAGIDALDALTMEHIYGARDILGEYGTIGAAEGGVTGRGGGEHVFEGAPFAMRSYFWGDCDCGYDEFYAEWESENPHRDECYRTGLDAILDSVPWGKKRDEAVKSLCIQHGIDPDAPGSYVHCTCDFPERWDKMIAGRNGVGHTETCGPERPNFEHFESGFEARWYKHSHRGETTNREISSKEWRAIQRECEDWILAQPPAFRVLVTGSRDWAPELYRSAQGKGDHPSYKRLRDDWVKITSEDKDTMIEAFRAARQKAGDARMVIVQGGASGADNLAWALGEIADNCEVETHRALWNRQGNTYNRAAGFERNARMVETGVDLCIGFFKRGAGNRGTKHCFDLAAKAGVETMEVWSN